MFNVLNILFVPNEVKAVLQILDQLDSEFYKSIVFIEVKTLTKKVILSNSKQIAKHMKERNISPTKTAYAWINNISGDMLESGDHHVYRGVLNAVGEDLLKIFDRSADKLCNLGEMNELEAREHKEAIRSNIKNVG